ncbi:hypothetical protein CcCBS67573_g10250 [Chytriomyces confervae]|uniref:Uncharacterized protein n=1 Tax=Chytriomyces confervae TaxID=246404 RepID=A0A507D7F9_9FUNG|nr:hypothetical protein CcCBS67573_g10250 [Chytriomyces confervae]
MWDAIDGKLVVKVLNLTSDDSNGEYLMQMRTSQANEIDYHPNVGRRACNSDEEMGLYVVQTDPVLQPNHAALALHKTACLIWKMAGGANEDYDECCMQDDDEGTFTWTPHYGLPAGLSCKGSYPPESDAVNLYIATY